MAHHILREIGAIDQRVEIDTRLDSHLVAHEDEILRANIPRRALMPGKGAAAQAGASRVIEAHAHLQPGEGVGDAHAARVMKMKTELELGEAVSNRADDMLHG